MQIPISNDHHVAMAEIHRRIAPSNTPPSLNWHIALWPEPNFRAHSDIDRQNRSRNDWLEKINRYISNLERILTSERSNDNLSIPITDSESDLKRAKFLPIYGKYNAEHSFYWKIKVEAHFEYVTISVFLSFSRADITDFSEMDDDKPDRLYDWPEPLSNITPDELLSAIKSITINEPDQDALVDNSSTIFDKIWDQLAEAALQGIDIDEERFGYLFADFRSLVFDTSNKFDLQSRKNELDRQQLKSRCEEAISVFSNNYKLMINGARRKEIVACSMLDDRYVYISTLGSRDDERYIEEGLSNSVKFVIIGVVESDKYQIGRLLERLHSIGVSRLAALKDLDRIRNIGRRVQAMGLELDEITRPDQPSLDEVEDFLVSLNRLGTEDSHDDIIADGASYRISRSAFYTSVVETRVADLRIDRIEKWQPYDEVLRRRLYPTYRFIMDVGHRIDKLRDRVNSINWIIETRTSRSLLEERVAQVESQDKLSGNVLYLTIATVFIGLTQIIIALMTFPELRMGLLAIIGLE